MRFLVAVGNECSARAFDFNYETHTHSSAWVCVCVLVGVWVLALAASDIYVIKHKQHAIAKTYKNMYLNIYRKI